MIKIIKNIKYSEWPAQYRRRKSSGSGFVILFAVTLAAILLSIALGVTNIAQKEIKFGTSVKDSNDAFYAADTGVEFVLLNDKSPNSIYPIGSTDVIVGSTGQSCASVNITKVSDGNTPPLITTTIVSKGYNIGDASCNSPNPNRVERELQVTTFSTQ